MNKFLKYMLKEQAILIPGAVIVGAGLGFLTSLITKEISPLTYNPVEIYVVITSGAYIGGTSVAIMNFKKKGKLEDKLD